MDVEEFFEEWEEDDWAEFIEETEEDGEIAVQSEEDCIDSESDSGDEGNVVIKCSKCKKPDHPCRFTVFIFSMSVFPSSSHFPHFNQNR